MEPCPPLRWDAGGGDNALRVWGQHMAGDAEQAGGIAQDAAGSAKARVLGGSAVQVGLRQLDEIL